MELLAIAMMFLSYAFILSSGDSNKVHGRTTVIHGSTSPSDKVEAETRISGHFFAVFFLRLGWQLNLALFSYERYMVLIRFITPQTVSTK